MIKTRSAVFRELGNRILTLHGYDVPEIVMLRVADGLPPYLDWIDEQTSTDS